MGWSRGDEEDVLEYQKWDYINLSDFRSASCGKSFSYGWLWFLVIISIAVYASDTYTAVVLLAYDHWSSQIKPWVPFDIAKWIFAGCILFSWILLGYEMLRAYRVIRRGSVAESYLDPNAVNLQSMRLGSGQGFRRFLVFAELTKSKKGADYVAIFAYFQFKGAIRVLLAEGPRQVLNALTLYSVMEAQLLNTPGSKDQSSFIQFWLNVKALAVSQEEHAAILFTMLFTLVIWVFSAICFLAALILYVFFLWHYIPSGEGGLAAYCRKKVDKRLEKIVGSKVQKAIAKAEAKRQKDEAFHEKFTGSNAVTFEQIARKPTLPSLLDEPMGDGPKPLSRTATGSSQTTLPPYPGTPPRLPIAVNSRPIVHQRTFTGASNSTYRSNRPLLAEAADMGHSDSPMSSDPFPRGTAESPRPGIGRAATGGSMQEQGPPGMFRKPLPVRAMTGGSVSSLNSVDRRLQQPTPPVAVLQPGPMRNFSNAQRSASPSPITRTPSPAFDDGSSSMYEMQPQRRTPSPPQQEPRSQGGYVAYNPYRAESPAMPRGTPFDSGRSTPVMQPPRRAFTEPMAPEGTAAPGGRTGTATPPQRFGTAPPPATAQAYGEYSQGNHYFGPGSQGYSRPAPRPQYSNGGHAQGGGYGYSSAGRW